MTIDVKKSKLTAKKRSPSALDDPVSKSTRSKLVIDGPVSKRTRSKFKVIDGVAWTQHEGHTRKEDVKDVMNMLASVDTTFADEEDDALVEYEEGVWECPKCQHSNRNDAGYCNKIVGKGKGSTIRCGGKMRCVTLLTWGNCFSQVCYGVELCLFLTQS